LQRIIIFANGELSDPNKARHLLHADDFIICADGGTRHALALGLIPNVVIGDMDSIQKDQWQELEQAGIAIELYPRDKNETDLELAINYAVAQKPRQIFIIAALGGRLDQTLANISLLSNLQYAGCDIRLDDGVEEIFFCRDQAQVHGRSGDTVSLIPWQGPVSNIQTADLKWALRDETLYPDKTRGISNEMLGGTASISIGTGLLLVVHRRNS